jgi:glycerol-3-phosphate acyltransferase PlsY
VTISTFIVLSVGYLLGSIPFAYLLARRHRGIDLRLAGRQCGRRKSAADDHEEIGVSAMALDVGKGIAACSWRGRSTRAYGPAVASRPCRAHLSCVARIPRRQGCRTTCGAFSILAPQDTAVATLVFLVLVWWTRYISLDRSPDRHSRAARVCAARLK